MSLQLMTEVSWGKDEEIKTTRGRGHLISPPFMI